MIALTMIVLGMMIVLHLFEQYLGIVSPDRRGYLTIIALAIPAAAVLGYALSRSLGRLNAAVEEEAVRVQLAMGAARRCRQAGQAVLDSLSAHICIVEADGKITATNDKWRNFARNNGPLNDSVCKGANYLRVCDEAEGDDSEGAARFAQGIRDVLEGRRDHFQMEYPCHSPDEQRWFIGRVTRMRGQKTARAIVAHENITHRRLAEDQLRGHLELFETLMKAIPIPLFYKGLDGRYIDVNPAFCKLLGKPREEMVGRRASDIAPETYAECYEQRDRELLRKPGVQSYEMALRDARGYDHLVMFRKATFNDPRGQAAGIVGMIVDITERKVYEERILSERAKLSAMIAGMEEGVVFADVNNRVVEVNEYFCKLVGCRRDDVVGRSIEELHSGESRDRITELLQHFRSTPDAEPYVMQRSMGEAEVMLRVQPIYRYDKYEGVLLNLINITDLVRARRQAEAANRMKSAFLANMSHEIRTPLTAILGYMDLLDDAETSSEDRSEYVGVMRRNGEHLLELINDLLDLSKIEAGKLTVENERCELPPLLSQLGSSLGMRARQKNIDLEIEFDGPIPEAIEADTSRLRQILVNLVGNAIKFTPEGSVRVVTRMQDGEQGRTIRIDVVDTGIGIAEEKLESVCEPFTQAETGTHRKYGGTGLGLAISKNLARLMGGELQVESTPGQGSTFGVVLPAGDLDGMEMIDDPASLLEQKPSSPKEGTVEVSLEGLRVLLAEDGPDNQRLLKLLLTRKGAEATVVENGRAALDRAKQDDFDVILMDMQMPVMDGYEATRRLRQADCPTPIIALTAHALSGEREKCLGLGCDEYVSKPIDAGVLFETIRRAVDDGTSDSPRTMETPSESGQSAGVAEGEDRPKPKEPKMKSNQEPKQKSENAIRSEFADDPEVGQLVAEFVRNLRDYLREMSDAIQAGDFETLRRTAHQIKGAGGSYGLPPVSEQAAELESAAKQEDTEASQVALSKLRDIAGRIRIDERASTSTAEKE